ncbi:MULTISPECIES: hypothetical protein [unclassified Bartonella]|uniref:hypothetical protein n=1 Tax=unclassified Bartonella TaxID=2645622 RepID=UPI0023616E2E|nr:MULTISPECIES: hypothetical protein [unclassified Bartonella]
MKRCKPKLLVEISHTNKGHSLLKNRMYNLIKETIEFDLRFHQQVQLGIDSANAGDVVSFEEILM